MLKGFINVFNSDGRIILSAQPLGSRKMADADLSNYTKDFERKRVAVIDLSKIPSEAIEIAVTHDSKMICFGRGCRWIEFILSRWA